MLSPGSPDRPAATHNNSSIALPTHFICHPAAPWSMIEGLSPAALHQLVPAAVPKTS
jgi:hypothetical protein